jgi:tight adherence protein B
VLISTSVFLFFLFLTYAMFLLISRKPYLRQERLEQRVREALQEKASGAPEISSDIYLEDSIGGGVTLNRLLSSVDFIKTLDKRIKQADVKITVSRLLFFCLIAGFMAFFATYTVTSLWMAVIVGAIAAFLPIFHINRKRNKRLVKFNAQLPDTLDLLSRSLSVGHAFSESLNQVASEMPNPVATEFRITFEEQKLGLSTTVALARLAERVPLLDLQICITAMNIQRETGGNLAEILEKVAQTIRERFKLMEDFRTMTTSARGSAWILCALPIFIVFMMYMISPEYMNVLIYDQRGHYILAAAAVLQIAGMVTIRRILDIRV